MSLEVKLTNISIDGKYYDVKPEKNLLETCLALGLDIPHFCYHPALGSVGACRLCAVKKFKDKKDTKGRIVMSCMEPVSEGLIISIDDPETKAFRASVLEGLMINHPHDCPVCDEGGECHLQDMTVMTGHNYRHYDFEKRTFFDQDMGPFISHEMNRCIQCYRCVRFYRDYAGGKDLNVFGSRNRLYFGRHEEGTLENEFSGNLVEVCPTGVFTDKTLKQHFTRKWDLSNAPSVCVHCSVGCNTIASERYGSLRRIMNRYNGAVNGYFICDRGRFGYEFVNEENRVRNIMIRDIKKSNPRQADTPEINAIFDKSLGKDKKIIGIGSPRASIESNFALLSLVGRDNFFHGISGSEQDLAKMVLDFYKNSKVICPSLKQISKADAVLVLCEDITNTAPMIALSLRQALRNASDEEASMKGIQLWNDGPMRELAQNARYPLYVATPFKDSLDELAVDVLRASYDDICSFGSAIATLLDEKAPVIKINTKSQQDLAEKIAITLKNAKNPLLISGVTCNHEGTVQSVLNISRALLSTGSNVMLTMILPECNSMGLAMMPGRSLDDAFDVSSKNQIDTLVILENDVYRRADERAVDKFLESGNQVIVLDSLKNKTSFQADVLLPAATFAESEGTIVNNEGRAQRYYKAISEKDQVKESWKWLNELIRIRGERNDISWNRFDDIVKSIITELQVFSKLKNYVPDADMRMLNAKIPRQTIRYSGRTAIDTNIDVSEPKISQDNDSALSYSMEGLPEIPPSSLVPFYWNQGWNSVQALYKYLDEPNGSMKGGDPGIRLIEGAAETSGSYLGLTQETPEYTVNQLEIIPIYRIFGSEELSSVSRSVAKRIQLPHIYVNQGDADRLKLRESDLILLDISGVKTKIEVKIDNSIPQGIAGFPVNLPGMKHYNLPAPGKLISI